jgi:hypothetical protein
MNSKIHLRDLKKDDVFYECEYGINLKCRALSDPVFIDEGDFKRGHELRVLMSRDNALEIDTFFQSDDESTFYLSHWYREPEYYEVTK